MSNIKYPAASLAVAVAFTTDMTELLTAMEITITPGSRAAMWARLGQLGIDTSHWVRSTRKYDNERLAQAVSVSQSVAEVMRRLGIIPAGGSHFHISNRIRRAGLDTSHFLGQAHNRGKPGRRHTPAEILVVRPPGSLRQKRERLVRAMMEMDVPYVCGACGLGPVWQGRSMTLAVDHINGD